MNQHLQFSIPSAVLDPTNPRLAISLSRQLGFDGLEFPTYSPSLRLPDLFATGRREFSHLLSSQNQRLSSLRVDLGSMGLTPAADIDRALLTIEKSLETARSLSCPLLTLEIGPLPEPPTPIAPKPTITPGLAGLILLPTPSTPPAPTPPPTPLDESLASHIDSALRELGHRADRYSTPIAIRSELSSYAALDRTLRAANCPWFGIDLDPVCLLRDPWSSDDIFSKLGHLIRHVRARDATLGSSSRTRPAIIGQGSTDWPSLLTSLHDSSYHGFITIDPTDLPDRQSAARIGLSHLRTFLTI